MTARATLPEPITVEKFWKTRWRNEAVHITLSEHESHCLIDIRVFRTGINGIDYATTKGLALGVGKLPELVWALVKAEAMARERGLLPNDGAGE
jgi:hypothetical protein